MKIENRKTINSVKKDLEKYSGNILFEKITRKYLKRVENDLTDIISRYIPKEIEEVKVKICSSRILKNKAHAICGQISLRLSGMVDVCVLDFNVFPSV